MMVFLISERRTITCSIDYSVTHAFERIIQPKPAVTYLKEFAAKEITVTVILKSTDIF